jgi:hypothetical protein
MEEPSLGYGWIESQLARRLPQNLSIANYLSQISTSAWTKTLSRPNKSIIITLAIT